MEKLNERTCYFYRNQGLLDRPLQMGPFAQYGPLHVDQLLAIKALQRQGKSLAAVKVALKELTREDLTVLLRKLLVPEFPPEQGGAAETVPVEPFGQVRLAPLDSSLKQPPGWTCLPVGGYLLLRPPGIPEISEQILLQIQSLLKNTNV